MYNTYHHLCWLCWSLGRILFPLTHFQLHIEQDEVQTTPCPLSFISTKTQFQVAVIFKAWGSLVVRKSLISSYCSSRPSHKFVQTRPDFAFRDVNAASFDVTVLDLTGACTGQKGWRKDEQSLSALSCTPCNTQGQLPLWLLRIALPPIQLVSNCL